MIKTRITATAEIREYLAKADPIMGAVIEKYGVIDYREKISSAISPEDLFLLVEQARRQGRKNDMITYLNYIISDYPDSEYALDAIAMKAFLSMEDYDNKDTAIEYLEQMIDKLSEGPLRESAKFLLEALENEVSTDAIIRDILKID